jgi:6-phosphogluconate dehydrogenase
MVHNGIEYGLMQAYAEGFDVFDASEYELDNAKIAHLWNQGSVVRSWLCELAARAFEADGNELQAIEGWTEDSGEGRWTIEDATAHDVPTPVITASLYERLSSRGGGEFAHRVLAALRNQFGGHAVKAAGASASPPSAKLARAAKAAMSTRVTPSTRVAASKRATASAKRPTGARGGKRR